MNLDCEAFNFWPGKWFEKSYLKMKFTNVIQYSFDWDFTNLYENYFKRLSAWETILKDHFMNSTLKDYFYEDR